jgi:hypothetical protein
MTIATPPAEVLNHFPDSFEELPQMHRLLLAVLAARTSRELATTWPQLVQDTIRALARDVGIDAPRGGLIRGIQASLGDLADYGMVVPSVAGLALSPRTLAAEGTWNGAFKQLVKDVETTLAF